ncbi:MAG: MBL fold metallo-hydrolase [Hyphomicrobiales bacterium]|nr:MBL fold metallo-hydrolase [Hyphomicrobiales bacterium]MDE2283673.1 MBL fold metallo-hydrolase [Hyphomicrobiales bacterium]
MRLSFHGADRDVTGSCHLVECAGRKFLIDCGLFQGSRQLAEENGGDFGFDPASIDVVLLTHAHLDHCGRLPLLSKRGFRGEIITTTASRELAKLVMLDAAHLQEEEARPNSHWPQHGAAPPEPLYSVADALKCLEAFKRSTRYGEPVDLGEGARATFVSAGHILGSASILLEATEAGRTLRLLFSGDLGNGTDPLLLPPPAPPRADVAVMETTYGDRLHKPMDASIDELYRAIADTFARGGNVVIPAFALERAQELLFLLNQGIEKSRLKPSTQTFLDSPMAISATEIFARHLEDLRPEAARLFQGGHDPLALPGLRFTRDRAQSAALSNIHAGAIIMAGSGMATGGRIVHHLQHNLSRPECSVIFVGYAANGTLARRIINGQDPVRIFGEDIPVRAKIYTIDGFSAHADQAGLLKWQESTGAARTFLTHGEEGSMRSIASRLAKTQVEMPAPNQGFDL